MTGKKKDMKGGLRLFQKKPIINESNIMPIPIQKIQQNISCALPILSNYMQSDIKNTTKYTQDSDIPLHHQLYSLLFYGKSNYYNLKNV